MAAVLIILGTFIFSSMEAAKSSLTHPVTIVSNGSGPWEAASSWNLDRSPQSGDRVVIKQDHVITFLGNQNIHGFDGDIIVNGELRMASILLEMDKNSRLVINEEGKITFHGEYGMLRRNSAINIAGWLGYGGTSIKTNQQGAIAYGSDAKALLSIKLATLKGELTKEGETLLSWSVAAEKSHDFFIIERSLDGHNFFILDTIPSMHNGDERTDYTYKDLYPASGHNYYRLKQANIDGKFQYFDIVSVHYDKSLPQLSEITITPSPYHEYFEVNFHATDNNVVHLKLTNMQGKTIFRKSLETEKGANSFVYSDDQLQSGVYLFTIVQKGTPAKTFRIVKPSTNS